MAVKVCYFLFYGLTPMSLKHLSRCIVVVLVSLFCFAICGCETGDSADDNPGTETAISGNAKLKISVRNYKTNIYFDGQYIGAIEAGTSRTWSVPSGTHTVKATNAEVQHNPAERTITLAAGRTYVMSVSWM